MWKNEWISNVKWLENERENEIQIKIEMVLIEFLVEKYAVRAVSANFGKIQMIEKITNFQYKWLENERENEIQFKIEIIVIEFLSKNTLWFPNANWTDWLNFSQKNTLLCAKWFSSMLELESCLFL